MNICDLEHEVCWICTVWFEVEVDGLSKRQPQTLLESGMFDSNKFKSYMMLMGAPVVGWDSIELSLRDVGLASAKM